MTDYFALLQQRRRPWLDPEVVRQKYHELARTAHPDQPSSGTADFAQINEAQRVLSNPKLRLQHLLQLEGVTVPGIDQMPGDLGDLFMEIGGAMRSSKVDEIDAGLRSLEATSATTREQVQLLDQEWQNDPATVLPKLVELWRRLAFLDRWSSLLRERRLQQVI